MRARRSRMVMCLAAAGVGLLAVIACNMEATIEAQVSQQVPKGFVKLKAIVGEALNEGMFNFDGQIVRLRCTVTLVGTIDGKPVTRQFTAVLEAEGAAGARYKLSCTDPIAIQFPSDARNFVGTFDDGALSQPLLIQSGVTEVLLTPGRRLVPEAGQQIIMIDLPEGFTPGSYDFAFEFDLDSSRPIDVKPFVLGEIICDVIHVMPPLVPNASSFAQIPAVTLPLSDDPQPVVLPLDGVEAAETRVTCLRPDQLHVTGPSPNRVPTGAPASIAASVQRGFSGVGNVDVVFTRLLGDIQFTSGFVAADGQTATVTTNAAGLTSMTLVPQGPGPALVGVTVPGTSFSAFSFLLAQ